MCGRGGALIRYPMTAQMNVICVQTIDVGRLFEDVLAVGCHHGLLSCLSCQMSLTQLALLDSLPQSHVPEQVFLCYVDC